MSGADELAPSLESPYAVCNPEYKRILSSSAVAVLGTALARGFALKFKESMSVVAWNQRLELG